MTKLTKNEKILRKGNEKWKNFLAEGAFKKTLNESMDFRKAHFAARMEPEELELLNIPEEEYTTKSKEEVEAIAAALSKAHKQSQLGVELDYPKTATRDENEPILRLINKKQKATRAITGEKGYVHYSDEESKEYADTYSNDMPSDHHEQKEPPVSEARMGEYGKIDAEDGNPPTKIGRGNEEYMAAYNAVLQARGEEPLDIQKPDQAYLDALQQGRMKPSDHSYNLEEQEEKGFQVGEFVYVVNGSLKGASGKILEPVTTTSGEEGFVIELYSDAKMKVFGKRGDEVIALPQDLESGGTTDGMELYDIDERSADDERDLEEPVKFGSGAELEFDPKAEKYYDRKRDMYIDDPEEEDNLTREDSMRTTMSSDPELDQIEDIARDMLEAGIQNSRIPVGLMSVASALKAQGFDATVSSGVLNIDGKYFMGKKENFDISPDEDVRQVMGYVLGFMG